MFVLRKNTNFKISKITTFLFIFFASFFFLTKAEDSFEINVPLYKVEKIDYSYHIKYGLLDILTDSTYFSQEGGSSYYGKAFHNRRTACGQKFDMNKYTSAHRKLPFGTIVRIYNQHNHKTTLAIINDRGPYVRRRIIDVSTQIARVIGFGNPPLKLSGISNQEIVDTNNFSEHFIVFPLIRDVQMKDAVDINFLKQMDDFSESVELLHTLQKMHPNVPYCLAVSANEYFTKPFDRTYYVGILINYKNRFAITSIDTFANQK
jgi:rare lipoprotein A